jgi:hypothetical protein
MLNLQTDLKALEAKILEVGDVELAIIDPLTSYTGTIDESSNNKNRAKVLDPLSAFARRLGMAVCTITHFSKTDDKKSSRKAAHRVHGTIANLAAPRLNFAVISDPNNRDRKMLLETKINITKPQMSLAYILEEVHVAEGIDVPRVTWEDRPIDITADQLLALANGGEEARKERVADMILRVLAGSGGMTPTGISEELPPVNYGTICGTLRRMLDDGSVIKSGDKYEIATYEDDACKPVLRSGWAPRDL